MRAPGSRSSWNGVRISSSDGGRERVRDGVDEKRQAAREVEERAAERWRDEPHGRHPRHRHARRVGELRLRDDRLHRPARARAVEDRRARVDEGDDDDQPVRRVSRQHRRRRGRASAVAPAASDAIISRRRSKRSAATPAGALSSTSGRNSTRPDVAGLRRRAGQREREQRVRDPGDARPEGREQPAGLEEDEVAVAPQRDELGHASIVAGAAAAPRSPRVRR